MIGFPLKISSSVALAINAKAPVLALESTVITHGLPYPQSFGILNELEDLAREEGAVPATICVLDGVCRIGLEAGDIRLLEEKIVGKERIEKLAWRDLGMALARKESGGTTVSATMALAVRAGIRVFATGGIGGVHRDWSQSPDISMDIKALSEFPVVVVSAGCKAILDIGATLEVLESAAVPVYGWQTEEFPAFYSRQSGHQVAEVAETQQIARAFRHQQELRRGGMLIGNPIPPEAEIRREEIEPYIQKALESAGNMRGKALTPFLLDYLADATGGRSVQANLALLKNNVVLGARIAKELLS